MTVLQILQFPNPRLRTVGRKVEDFGDALQKVIDDMFDTHYNAQNCAALAATQLDIEHPQAITVIDFSESKDQPLCLVNAQIIEREGEIIEEEGCMSVGDGTTLFAKVKRAVKIKVKAQDRHGEALEFEAEGFMAKCIQHELDHLQGKLFIDHLSTLRREQLVKKLKKFSRLKKGSESE